MNKITFLRFTMLDSTNQKLYQLAEKNFPEFTVVSTQNQTNGKGQRGTTWDTTANKNITMSVLLRPTKLKAMNSFMISLWFTVYLHQYMSSCQINAKIKWPNDILFNKKKIGGILIENKIQYSKIEFSVIGLGLNVYQSNFKNLPKASSICIEFNKHGKEFSKPLKIFEEELIHFLFEHKEKLNTKYWEELKAYYYQHLIGYNQVSTFTIGNNNYNGIIKGITREGKLMVLLENQTQVKNFDIKEIGLLY